MGMGANGNVASNSRTPLAKNPRLRMHHRIYWQSEKLIKQQYLLHHTSLQYSKLGPLTAEIGSGVWGTPANFNGFRVLASLLHRRRSPETNFARCLHFRGLLPPDGVLPGAKFTLRPSLAFSFIGSVTARHSSWSSSGRQPNFSVWYKEWNYRTFAEGATCIRLGGHHVWHWPTL